MNGLDARVRVVQGSFTLDAVIQAAPGHITAVVGPNGSGKTTLLNALAGLQPIDAGRIELDGTTLDDPAADVFVAPEQRRIGLVFQDFLLFPHLSVRDNVEFGPRSRGDRDARDRAQRWLEMMGVDDLAERRPAQLSGGQSQRVAMARALATEPSLLLLDEPLAALDAATRLEVRRELRSHLRGFGGATLLVTHDPLDALVLADDVVVLESGIVTQSGTTDDVARRPATPYVATLMGTNLVHAVAHEGVARTAEGVTIAIADRQVAGEVIVILRPEAITLHRERPEGSARNVWSVVVRELEPRIDRVLVHVAGPPDLAAAVTPRAAAELGLEPGQRMWASAKALELDAFPRPV